MATRNLQATGDEHSNGMSLDGDDDDDDDDDSSVENYDDGDDDGLGGDGTIIVID